MPRTEDSGEKAREEAARDRDRRAEGRDLEAAAREQIEARAGRRRCVAAAAAGAPGGA